MRMPEKLEVLNFSADFSYHVKASNLLSIEYLHSNFMPSQLMFANCRRNHFNKLVPGLTNNVFRHILRVVILAFSENTKANLNSILSDIPLNVYMFKSE